MPVAEHDMGKTFQGAAPRTQSRARIARHAASRGRIVLLGGVLLTIALALTTALLLNRARNREIIEWQTRAATAATVIATHARQSFRATDLPLQAIIARLQAEFGPDEAGFRARASSPATKAMIAQYIGSTPQIDNAGILANDGTVLNSTRNSATPPPNLADRDYFRTVIQPGFTGVYISAPVQSRADGSWTFYLSCQITAPEANPAPDAKAAAPRPLGVLVAGVHVAYFQDFYSAISLGPSSTMLLLRANGTLLARDPPNPQQLGASLAAQPVVSALAHSETGAAVFVTDAPGPEPQSDGATAAERRIVATRRIDGPGLIAAVVVGEDLYLARWRAGTLIAAIAVGAICLAILGLTIAVARLLDNQERAAGALQTTLAELRASQAALDEKTRMFDLTLDHMDQGIALITADRRVPFFNRRGLQLLDLPPEIGSGNARFEDIQALQNARNEFAGVEESVRPALQSNEVFSLAGLYTRTRPNGVVLEIRTKPLPDGGLIRSYTDITERVRTESKLRQAQRLEAVGQLTAGIAHDFNNILGIIVGNLELATDQMLVDPDTAAHHAGEARTAAMLAAGLVRRLLAFSRLQALQIETTDLNALLSTTLPMLRQAIAGQLEIEMAPTRGLWPAQADGPQLQNALINLAANARAAAPAGSHLRIAAANVSLAAERGAEGQPDLPPGDYIRITVTDEGSGMSSETRARVFEPFFTTRPIGSGSGLGLSMVLGTLQQMGGTATIDSTEGVGTTVSLYLPRAVAAAA